MILKEKDLLNIVGGETTSSIFNALTRGISIFLDLGRTIGSAIRRAATGKTCSL